MNIEYEQEFTEKLNEAKKYIEEVNKKITKVEKELKDALPSDYNREKPFGYSDLALYVTKVGANVEIKVTCLSDEDKHNIIRYVLNKAESRLKTLYDERRRALQHYSDLLIAYE